MWTDLSWPLFEAIGFNLLPSHNIHKQNKDILAKILINSHDMFNIYCFLFAGPVELSECSATCGSGVMTGQSCDETSCTIVNEGCNARPCDGKLSNVGDTIQFNIRQ